MADLVPTERKKGQNEELTLSLILAFVLIVSGCGSTTTIALVHPKSGNQMVCPAPVGPIISLSKEDIEALKKMTPAERGRWGLEQCVSAYEAQGYVRVDTNTPDRLYKNSAYGWSVSYPGNWTIDAGDVAFIKIYPALGMPGGLCGIHSATVAQKTVDEMTDLVTAITERSLKQRGLSLVVLSRRRISLQNNMPANDVLVEIQPGGKSRHLYVVASGRGFSVDCDTQARDWNKLESYFDRIISSFMISN